MEITNKHIQIFLKIILVVLFCSLLFLLLKDSRPKNDTTQSGSINFVKIGGVKVKVDLALTSAEQSRGLSGRVSLSDGSGMLFVFPKPDMYSFWMKDMLFSIDIIWISEDGAVVHIERDVSPASYPSTFLPNAPAQYVLEVPARFAEKNGIVIGSQVLFLP